MDDAPTVPTVEQLVAGLKETLRNAFKDLDTWTPEERASSRHFTQRLLSRLPPLAKVFGLDVRMTSEDPRNWEFLYDAAFLMTGGSYNDRNGYFAGEAALRRAVLVLECEWSSRHNEILYDFSKLLLARARLRALVCYQSSVEHLGVLTDLIRMAIRSFIDGHVSDRYLICALAPGEIRFSLLDGTGNEVVSA